MHNSFIFCKTGLYILIIIIKRKKFININSLTHKLICAVEMTKFIIYIHLNIEDVYAFVISGYVEVL